MKPGHSPRAISAKAAHDPLGGGALSLETPSPACLQIHLPDGRIHSFALSRPQSTIGRSGGNDLVISDLALSKQHARIEKRGGEFVLIDAGSRNGTFLNDARVGSPVALSHGDKIGIGSCRLYFFSETVITSIGDPISDITTRLGQAPFRPDPAGYEEPTGFTFPQQLALARAIQKCMLPAENPVLPGFAVAADTKPCYAVGGDFYDFQMLDDGTFCFLLGDVARKGIPAAMLANYSQALVRGAWNYESDLSSLTTRVNRDIWTHSPPNQFVTMCIFRIDLGTGEMCYVNAGHCPPLLIRPSGSIEWLEESSLVLGILPDEVYKSTRSCLPPGALVALYSDGVTECRCERGIEFERARLAAFLAERMERPLESLISELEAELESYCFGPAPDDDVSILLLRRDR